MRGGRKILPDDTETWSALREQFGSYSNIGQHYGVSQQAASAAHARALARQGRPAGASGSYAQWIPWSVRVQHANHPAYRLRLKLARRETGGELSDTELTRLAEFLAFCEDATDRDGAKVGPVSLAYWPETAQGFYLVPRQPGDINGVRV
jgi:hypothetical protein